ncbi:MAG: HesA/MoeB/ThiF family protein [Alphaproteobacteria bacterium]
MKELSNEQTERYARHLILDQIDDEGQAKLMNATIVLIGAGGIGSPALLYLAAAGVGNIRLIDDDVVDLSNLQRQVLFSGSDISSAKVSAAKNRVTDLNPDVCLNAIQQRIVPENAVELLSQATLVIDGSDTYETRKLVADTCCKLQIPLVSASATQFDGQLAVFRPWIPERPCYTCLFPTAPRGRASCAEVGVFSPLVGMMGTMAAGEALKLVLDLRVNDQQLLLVDGLDLSFTPIRSRKNSDCSVCGNLDEES